MNAHNDHPPAASDPADPHRERSALLEQVQHFATIEYIEIDEDGSLLRTNASFARHVGFPAADLQGRSIAEFLTEADADRIRGWAAGNTTPSDRCMLNFVDRSNQPYTLQCIVQRRSDRLVVIGEPDSQTLHEATAHVLQINNEFATLTREIARKSRELEQVNGELERTLADLKTSYWHLQKIQEVLPVCMSCGQVKGDGSRWEPVIEYLKTNDIFLSHGYCPPCFDRLMTAMDHEEDSARSRAQGSDDAQSSRESRTSSAARSNGEA
ncbi:MAG: PAS domain S-box protein [Gemmatimonadetes bacterium]|nr:PAS domain S-box protein [Gemmatimonadota bacterium]